MTRLKRVGYTVPPGQDILKNTGNTINIVVNSILGIIDYNIYIWSITRSLNVK